MSENILKLHRDNLADRFPLFTLPEQLAQMGRKWGWFLIAGLANIILGIVAFSLPINSTIGLTFALGILFVVGGSLQVIHTIQLRNEVGNGWRMFHAAIGMVAGVLMLRYPGAGMIGVAIAMTFYFFVSAAAKTVLALGLRPHRGWGWAFASAVASFCLGAYIIATFPVSALWVPGFLLGIDLVILGLSLVGFSFDLKNVHGNIEIGGGTQAGNRRIA